MKIFVQLFLFATLLVGFNSELVFAAGASGEVTCECVESTCGKCEVETGVDFYTEKCGRANSKVKSCKRPMCKAVTDYEVCLAKNESEKPAAVRDVASARESAPAPTRWADVVLAVGKSRLERGEATVDLTNGMKVYAGDRIVTAEDGRVRIRFLELSEIFVSPMSQLVLTEALVEKRKGPSKRTIMLDLQKGRVRSRVQGRYDDGESKFEIKTRSAVAGVRGTEFVVSTEQTDLVWKTEVRTLKGEVSLDAVHENAKGKKAHATVLGGTFASYTVHSPPVSGSPEELKAALGRGLMTDVIKMTEDEAKELNDDKIFSLNLLDENAVERLPSSKDTAVLCRAPIGSFNQCSWTCEGSPKGSKKCRTDLSNVKCVRRLCRASGEWAEPTVLPVKDAGNCEGGGHSVVGDCGGYW